MKHRIKTLSRFPNRPRSEAEPITECLLFGAGITDVAMATVIKASTCIGNEWLAQRLDMGHNRSVSHLIGQGNDNKEIRKLCSEIMKMLPCEQQPPEVDKDMR